MGMFLLYGAALYVTAGLAMAAAFVTFGVRRVLPGRPSVSFGARILLLPGAAALWPYVLRRWLASRGAA